MPKTGQPKGVEPSDSIGLNKSGRLRLYPAGFPYTRQEMAEKQGPLDHEDVGHYRILIGTGIASIGSMVIYYARKYYVCIKIDIDCRRVCASIYQLTPNGR